VPTVELYGQARLLAGTRSVAVEALSLGEALRRLGRLHPELVGPVLEPAGGLTPAYTANLNGLRFCHDPDQPLADSDEILIISSLSGG
jgi:molybdopterin converting factor small subunit